MNRGYIKIWRKIEDNGLISNADACQLLVFLLIKASRVTRKIMVGTQLVTLNSGQFFAGRKQLAQALNSSEQKVRTALKVLEKLEIISQQPTSKGTVISIINWDKYQNEQPAANQPKKATLKDSENFYENGDFCNQHPTSVEHDDMQYISTVYECSQPAPNQQYNQQPTSGQPAPNQRLTTKQELEKEEKKKKNPPISPLGDGEGEAQPLDLAADSEGLPILTETLLSQIQEAYEETLPPIGWNRFGGWYPKLTRQIRLCVGEKPSRASPAFWREHFNRIRGSDFPNTPKFSSKSIVWATKPETVGKIENGMWQGSKPEEGTLEGNWEFLNSLNRGKAKDESPEVLDAVYDG